ncbi:MAG: hypothetical protein H7Y30_18365 [Pyrinomonadaceae bacterium]|nr:hypothetical protein [Pyrinomonadaceae bacterium]
MTRLFLGILFLTFAHTWVGLINSHAQAPTIPHDWKTVSACQIRFSTPKDLKNQNVRGIDSCYAEFRNSKMRLTIDSGSWGGVFTRTQTNLDFKEEFIDIDGKKAQVVTYKDAQSNSSRKFVAGFYVALYESPDKEKQPSAFLYMTARVKSEKELEVAKQIFRSIRFDAYRPFTIEQ